MCEIACAACASQALDCWDFSQLLGLGWRIVATGYDGDALSKRHHLKAADKNRSSPRPPAVEIFFPQLSVTPQRRKRVAKLPILWIIAAR